MNERGHSDGSPVAVAARHAAAMRRPTFWERSAQDLLEIAQRLDRSDPAEATRLRAVAQTYTARAAAIREARA